MNPAILEHLSKDPKLKTLIQQIKLKDRPAQKSVYEALIRSVTFQQLSGKAATTIYGRFINLFENHYPNPHKVLAFEEQTLKASGLSRQKASYIKNIAAFFLQEQLMDKNWSEETNEAIIEKLMQIKGVGKWTVEMILMFTLKRLDVLPLDDLVIKNSMIKLYGVEGKGKELTKKLIQIAEAWRPYRSVACYYLWQYRDVII